MSKPTAGADPTAGARPGEAVPAARMFSDEGQLVLDENQRGLFPFSVRPPFMRLLWLALVLLAGVLAVALTAIAGRLP